MKTKSDYINLILVNSTYMPNSGVVKNLEKGLRKLSLSDLANLALIIGIKSQDAIDQSKYIAGNY